MDSLPSWARPGVKVVCVSDFSMSRIVHPDVNFPIIGEIYTIGRIAQFADGLGIYLVEVRNSVMLLSNGQIGETSFDVLNFKPLVSKTIEDDIAIFAPLLNTKKEEELV